MHYRLTITIEFGAYYPDPIIAYPGNTMYTG